MKLGFVFTNYNNSIYTRNVVKSILTGSIVVDCYIVIVDNNSENDDIISLNSIASDYPEISIIFNNENVGYFKGLNIGIEYLRNFHPDCEYIVVGNNDLIFPQDFQLKIKSIIHNFSLYPVISPNLITIDGVHQNPHVLKSVSKLREFVYDIYFTNYYFSIVIYFLAKLSKNITERTDYKAHHIAGVISQGYGACYILGPIFFQRFKFLWAPSFLMGEELFLSMQLMKEGFKIYYEPTVIVNHHDHATMGKLPGKKLWLLTRDSHRIYKKHR
jgi:GT2 family glycosyltransferase